VDRTLHHANRLALVAGNPLTDNFTVSRSRRTEKRRSAVVIDRLDSTVVARL
jgi:hypothetical protein